MVDRKRNRELFARLLAMAEHSEYTDEYLLTLIEFWRVSPYNGPDGDIFYARYAMHYGNYAVALEYGERSLARRVANRTLWRLLATCYAKTGAINRALYFAGLASKFYADPINIDVPREQLAAGLDILSLGLGAGDYAPVAKSRMYMTDAGLESRISLFSGEFLPQLEPEQREYRYFVGSYLENEFGSYKAAMLEGIKNNPKQAEVDGADFEYEIARVKPARQSYHLATDSPVILPVMGTDFGQNISFSGSDIDTENTISKWGTSYFRIEEPVSISSNADLLVGEPIRLEHSPQRKKAVISVLLDGMCWRAIRDRNYDLVPNMLRFFSRGVIFDNNFSVGEYTYPSLPTIETGLYPYHSQIFNERGTMPLNHRYVTLSEQLKAQGYYCTQVAGASTGIYAEVQQGFDRMVVNNNSHTYIAVERIIRQLEAFSETDQYIYAHTEDTHPWGGDKFELPLTMQTSLSLAERSIKEDRRTTSVYLPNRPLYTEWNIGKIREVDEALGRLFSYLEANYGDDEYLIMVYSDHGAPIYNEKYCLLSEYQNSAALMLRGAGVPAVGRTAELTSLLDIYPIMAHLLGFTPPEYLDGNLPAVFGGQEREYTVSMSMYSGIPFMACIRDARYAFIAESQGILDEDGRTDLEHIDTALYERSDWSTVDDPDLQARFLAIARRETAAVDNYGVHWPDMRDARPGWFLDDTALRRLKVEL